MKKILIISPFNIFPPYWGGASRIYNLATRLSKDDKVTLLYNNFNQMNDVKPETTEQKLLFETIPVKSQSRLSQIFNPLLIIEGIKIIKKEKHDVIIAEFAWSGIHAIILSRLLGIPYYLDEHNVEYIRFKRMNRGNKLSQFLLKSLEKISCNMAKKVYVVSEVDKIFLKTKLHIDESKIEILENMVDTDRFYPSKDNGGKIRKKLDINQKTPLILFFGKLDYKPNTEAVEIIRKKILSKVIKELPDAKFLIVGSNPPMEFKHKSIIFTGPVKKIEDYINASDIVIAPLLSGGGTRIKIMESLACSKQVISTSIGAEGLITNDKDGNIIIINDLNDFGKYIITILKK